MASKGVNKVILVGNLGQEPETKYLPSGGAVTNISVATSESWKDKNTGQMQERTEWHRVVFFNRLAEIAGEYLRKGSKVYLEGSLRTRKWQDNNGNDRHTAEIVASEMQMLDSRGDNDGQQQAGLAPQAPQQPMQAAPQQMAQPQQQMAPQAFAPQQMQQAPVMAQQQPMQQPQPINQPPVGDDDIPW